MANSGVWVKRTRLHAASQRLLGRRFEADTCERPQSRRRWSL